MAKSKKSGFKIRSKVLTMLVSLSLISLLGISILAYISWNKVEHTIDEIDIFFSQKISKEKRSEKNTLDSLRNVVKELYITSIISDKVNTTQSILQKIEDEVDIMADMATSLWGSENGEAINPLYTDKTNEKIISKLQDSKKLKIPDMRKDKINLDRDIKLIIHMDELIRGINEVNTLSLSTYMGTESQLFLFYSNEVNADKKDFSKYNPTARPWYKNAAERKGVYWTPTYKDKLDKTKGVTTCSRAFYDSGGMLAGVVGIDVDEKVIAEKGLGITEHNRDKEDIEESFIVDEEKNLIASSESPYIDYLFENTNLIDKMIHNDSNMFSYDSLEIKGNYVYISCAKILSTGWSLCTIIPGDMIGNVVMDFNEDFQEDVTEKISVSLIGVVGQYVPFALILLIILIIIISFKFSSKITNPILALCNDVKLIGNGNLDNVINIKTGDEIQTLGEAFNSMTTSLKNYMEDLKVTTAEKEKIESDLRIASRIQQDMLPKVFPPFGNKKAVNLFASMKAAKEVGGDFFDFFYIDDKKFCFIIADVSGKGIPASLFMVISKTLLKTVALQGHSPAEILYKVNNILYIDNNECMFVTVFCAILDIETGELQFSNGGHNPPLLAREGEDFDYIELNKGKILGIYKNFNYTNQTLQLKSGDTIFLYTDGVTEAMDNANKQFSESRLKDSLVPLKENDINEIEAGIQSDLKVFVKDAPQSDDITIVVTRYTP
jgi:sigma-B regulation protein RsbU (phosphoserine phosphatase)